MAPCTRRPGAGWLGVTLPLRGLLLLTLLQHAATASQLDANQVSAGGKQSGSWGTCSGPATRPPPRAAALDACHAKLAPSPHSANFTAAAAASSKVR